jgi:hypothetical protein
MPQDACRIFESGQPSAFSCQLFNGCLCRPDDPERPAALFAPRSGGWQHAFRVESVGWLWQEREEGNMPTYVSLPNFTDQGIWTVTVITIMIEPMYDSRSDRSSHGRLRH